MRNRSANGTYPISEDVNFDTVFEKNIFTFLFKDIISFSRLIPMLWRARSFRGLQLWQRDFGQTQARDGKTGQKKHWFKKQIKTTMICFESALDILEQFNDPFLQV